MERLTAAGFEELSEKLRLPKPFSKLCAEEFSSFIVVGYAVGEADNRVYVCLRYTLGSRDSPVIALPVNGRTEFMQGAHRPAESIKLGLYRHYKGSLYYVQGTCNIAESGHRTAVLYSAVDSGLPFMWLRYLEDWKSKAVTCSGEVERFTKL